ncbi:sensor histidine kinase [Bacillus sp. NTK071]|uniref:sensor histidine kinase n=1 Tax=Bacillus sp. NTK071 TaxID=2802175 RepID=UPI001A8CB9D4|nr:sensor histidine kinase [Bacillus sp. NTK071]MBN8209352.1 sensor histidine kinase [Bacillus sp. NTK071]
MKSLTLRWTFFKSTLYISLFAGLIFFLFVQIWLLFSPISELVLSLVFPIVTMIIVLIVGSYFSYKNTSSVKDRLEDLSMHIKSLSKGKFSERVEMAEKDEIGTISEELNELAEKLQKQVTSLQNLANQKADLADQARGAAIIEERQRLARDLHDAVSQQLFALNMMSSAALKVMDRDMETAKTQMIDVADLASKAQVEMRALLLHLRPVHLSDDTLGDGIEKLIQELQKKSGVDFHLLLDQLPELSKGIEDNLFRIVQESLGNALRHADASDIHITCKLKNNQLLLQIKDNGTGFTMEHDRKGAYGLGSMQERCDEIGSQLSIVSRIEEGTLVEVRVPMEDSKHDQ